MRDAAIVVLDHFQPCTGERQFRLTTHRKLTRPLFPSAPITRLTLSIRELARVAKKYPVKFQLHVMKENDWTRLPAILLLGIYGNSISSHPSVLQCSGLQKASGDEKWFPNFANVVLRYEVVLMLDGDHGGETFRNRISKMFLDRGKAVRCINSPSGKDVADVFGSTGGTQ